MAKSKGTKHRFHAFEFNEVAFLPDFIRESTPEVLGKATSDSLIYEPAGRIFGRFCATTGCANILELASGTGRPVLSLIDSLRKNDISVPNFILSDLYPNMAELLSVEKRCPEHISIIQEPFSALAIPTDVNYDAICMIASFHHFSVSDAFRILATAVKNNKPIFIMEPITGVFKESFDLGVHYTINCLKNPFTAKTNKLAKCIFTYLMPILPFVSLWDAWVSMARIYSNEEFFAMTEELTKFSWGYLKIPAVRNGKVCVYYGMPQ